MIESINSQLFEAIYLVALHLTENSFFKIEINGWENYTTK